MTVITGILLVLHFIGLTLGFSVSIANMIMAKLIANASPPERAVLARFPPLMSRAGRLGLGLLWVTGIGLLVVRWTGFLSSPPVTFVIKLVFVLLLTATVLFIQRLERRAAGGDRMAAARIPVAGKLAGIMGLGVLVFSVLTFW